MKILSITFTALFLLFVTSVAQIRYALMHPLELGPVLLDFAMAFCIFMVILNSTKIKLPKNFRIRFINLFTFKKQPDKAIKIS